MKIRDGEKGEEKVKIFPSTDVCCSILKRILAKFEAKGTKKKRKMNIRVSRAKRIEIEERKKKKYLWKILFIKKKRNEETSLAKIIRNNTLTLRVEFLSKTGGNKKKKDKI